MDRKHKKMLPILIPVVLIVLPIVWYALQGVQRALLDRELVQAVHANDIARVKRALDHGANPNTSETLTPLTTWRMIVDRLLHRHEEDSIPLLLIAMREHRHDVRLLLVERGANPNVIDAMGTPVLMAAVAVDDVSFAQALLQHGANPNTANPDGATALMWAANHWGIALTDALLAHGADPNAANRDGQTPLMWAIGPVAPDPTPPPNAFVAPGSMPVPAGTMTAVRNANLAVVKTLLAHGASASARDGAGNSVLAYAASQSPNWGHGPLVLGPLLIAHGADVNARLMSSQFNFTLRCADLMTSWSYSSAAPLHQPLMAEFARKGELETVRQMLAHGAAINARDDQGRTALSYATDPKVRALLTQAGAKN